MFRREQGSYRSRAVGQQHMWGLHSQADASDAARRVHASAADRKPPPASLQVIIVPFNQWPAPNYDGSRLQVRPATYLILIACRSSLTFQRCAGAATSGWAVMFCCSQAKSEHVVRRRCCELLHVRWL